MPSQMDDVLVLFYFSSLFQGHRKVYSDLPLSESPLQFWSFWQTLQQLYVWCTSSDCVMWALLSGSQQLCALTKTWSAPGFYKPLLCLCAAAGLAAQIVLSPPVAAVQKLSYPLVLLPLLLPTATAGWLYWNHWVCCHLWWFAHYLLSKYCSTSGTSFIMYS